MWFNQYPYINVNDLNLDYLLKAVKQLRYDLENFVNINTIKYADPIQWNITKQYEANTVVIDANDGTAYLSVKPVPTGVAITNTDYWTPIFTLNLLSANQNITLRDDSSNVLATFASVEGDWLIWNNTLYKVSRPIAVNEAYVVGYNLNRFSVELFIKEYINNVITMIGDLDDLNTTDKDDIVSAINEVLQKLSDTVGDLNDLNTTDKTDVVSAINEVLNTCNLDIVTPQMFGAVGDGVNDDTIAIQSAINSGKWVIVPKGRYKITSKLTMVTGGRITGVKATAATGNTYGSAIVVASAVPAIEITPSTPCTIENLTIEGANPSAGDGIIITDCDHFKINDVHVINMYNGIEVSGTSYGEIVDCVCERNYNNGFTFTNSANLGTCQVQVHDCLAELNDGIGFSFVNSHSSVMAVGLFSGNKTFANTRGGVVYQSTDASYKIAGVYVANCFLGSDGGLGCLYISKTTMPATFVNNFIEQSGMSATGRTYSTPAGKTSAGIYIYNDNDRVVLMGCTVETSASAGISNLSNDTSVIGCSLSSNGVGTTVVTPNKSDIVTFSPIIIDGCMFDYADVGVYVYGNVDARILGNSFKSNLVTPVQSGGTNTVIKNNIGVADN